ncbi:MAG: ion transporter [Pseudomonadota bacterium]
MPEGKHHRRILNDIIFGYETPAGRRFDLILIVLILLSVLAVMLDSVASIHARFHAQLLVVEWLFTGIFTVEYLLRLYCTGNIRKYTFSFFGLVDLFTILPTYLALFFPGATYLTSIRILRVMRIFRILKLMRFIGEANILIRALMQARRKILIFILFVLTLNVVFGALMYVVEGPAHGFTSIPMGVYWSIVTVTTVGYGDISPATPFGQLIASLSMLTGYAIIAVPTGIVSSELMTEFQNKNKTEGFDFTLTCAQCQRKGHDRDAHYCKQCGIRLPETTQAAGQLAAGPP